MERYSSKAESIMAAPRRFKADGMAPFEPERIYRRLVVDLLLNIQLRAYYAQDLT